MNRRGKRLALGVMAVGLAVVLVLAIAHWETVRDHVEAWHLQLTRKTVTIKADPALKELPVDLLGFVRFRSLNESPSGQEGSFAFVLFEHLSFCSGNTVIVQEDCPQQLDWGGPGDLLGREIPHDSRRLLVPARELEGSFAATARRRDLILECLRLNGLRVIEQRFPRRAYVIILDESRFVYHPGIGIPREDRLMSKNLRETYLKAKSLESAADTGLARGAR